MADLLPMMPSMTNAYVVWPELYTCLVDAARVTVSVMDMELTQTAELVDAKYNRPRKLYGGPEETIYFRREVRKSSFRKFGSDWSVSVSRAGDFFLYSWLDITLPSGKLNNNDPNKRLHWTHKVGLNMLKHVSLTFNNICAFSFDKISMDFWTNFTTPTSHPRTSNGTNPSAPTNATDAAAFGPTHLPSHGYNQYQYRLYHLRNESRAQLFQAKISGRIRTYYGFKGLIRILDRIWRYERLPNHSFRPRLTAQSNTQSVKDIAYQ
ncbi:hypothetical protein SARC_01201 [Sphaeroforma arctica JP610]|uniref:Major capsid protein N-terminal domain-containing protein n=1 Tax=Sphaeroforma arctica JP610 TaxID=667725 RepID=A0A0L0GCN3_9EUKA|nr:hypothetical protein SARC_01201 [Sphaeroforma arctica JP610]KNC86664.1 hypothetical protein SARC_01201 [Sphaeroforma arctica JP610]|eukprot:XP_014160566.1 hypothetical protein SARC_01201 [Sphaeroforma arctica JP610]